MPRDNTHEDALLLDFIAGRPHARDTLPRLVHHRLVGLARKLAPDLAERDLDEDVVQRTWELLLRKQPGSFDPERGTAMAYLGAIMYNAAHDVRAEHAPLYGRTRFYRRPTKPERRRYAGALLRARDAEQSGDDAPPWELIPDPHDDIAELECRLHAAEILALARATAPATVLRALCLIHDDDLLLAQAARAAGCGRFTLRRQLHAWATEQLEILAAHIGRRTPQQPPPDRRAA